MFKNLARASIFSLAATIAALAAPTPSARLSQPLAPAVGWRMGREG
jgi:hypothetical protein